MLCTEIVSDIQNNFCTQHVLPMFYKKKSFWQKFTCTKKSIEILNYSFLNFLHSLWNTKLQLCIQCITSKQGQAWKKLGKKTGQTNSTLSGQDSLFFLWLTWARLWQQLRYPAKIQLYRDLFSKEIYYSIPQERSVL